MPDRTMYATAPRRTWPWVAAIVAIAVIAGVAFWAGSASSDSPKAGPTPTPTPGTTSSSAPQAPAQGCLGSGQESPGDAVLAAQQQAPLTGDGAAAFMAAVLRWGTVLPAVPDELESVGPQVMSSDFPAAALKDLKAAVAANDEPGLTATVVGRHYEVKSFDGTSATVVMTAGFIKGGAQTNQSILVNKLAIEDGLWHWSGVDEPALRQLAANDNGRAARTALDSTGTAFEEAC
jgi:hypothetical protein